MRDCGVLLLLCGLTFAHTLLVVGSPDVQAGSVVLEGKAHGRRLAELAEASTTQLTGTLEVDVNPGVVCNVFPREAAIFPNGIYRQTLQSVAEQIAQKCSVPPPTYGKYVAQISTTCRGDSQTKLAKSIRIGFKSTDVAGVDQTQGACFLDGLKNVIDSGQYICIVHEVIQGQPPDVARWAPVLPPGACPLTPPP